MGVGRFLSLPGQRPIRVHPHFDAIELAIDARAPI
jgi:hypothetical protein